MGRKRIDKTWEARKLINQYIINDESIGIRKLLRTDVSERYVGWLNDPRINEYLECRHTKHTLKSVLNYVDSLNQSSELLYGIFDVKNGLHIGNVKVGPVNKIHKQASIGLLIGERNYWGKGLGTKVITYISKYATRELGLETLTAGCYECNLGSYRAFMKSGWEKVGIINNYWKYQDKHNKRTGQIIMQFQKEREIEIPNCGGITIIGGGKLMKDIALYAKKYSEVLVVVSKRHHEKEIEDELKAKGCIYYISDDINNDSTFESIAKENLRICLCFGPAWIFDQKIIDLFEGRIFNFNGIPLPKYVGGAHYTWQILNGSKEGGAYIQQITSDIDRGKVAKQRMYQLNEKVRLPIDYERENSIKGYEFLQEFLYDIFEKKRRIQLANEEIDWKNKQYFPRLHTSKNGWINWQWSGKEIIRFCEAFGEPYSGANTTVNGSMKITIKGLRLVNNEYYHPYCSGLIINRIKNKSIYIASTDGLLICDNYEIDKDEMNVGDRLLTPQNILGESLHRVRFGSDGLKD
jgi:methionyl-tRNA formyltransferase/RimJ/RimL family protein N-acetyltransferase